MDGLISILYIVIFVLIGLIAALALYYFLVLNKQKVEKKEERQEVITNDSNITIPDLTGLSSKVAKNLLENLGIKVKLEGVGYVTSQSIPSNTPITNNLEMTLTLEPKFQVE